MGSGGGLGRGGEVRVGLAARPLVSLLGSLRDALDRLEPDQVPARDAVDLVEVLDRIERLAAAGKALAAGRVAESSLWSRGGHRSAAHWMAKVCGVTVGDAVRMLNLAETVVDAPATKDALVAGRLSGRQADVVARAEKADPEAGRTLAEAAPTLSMGELRTEADRITAAASSESPEQVAERHRRARRFRHGMTAEGMGWGTWLLPPAEHCRAVAAIEGERARVFTEARRSGEREPVEAHAADALCRVLDRASEGQARPATGEVHPPSAGGNASSTTGERHPPRPDGPVSGEPDECGGGAVEDWSFAKVLVIADLAALDRGRVEPGERCEIAGQGPVPVPDVWKMIDGDAFVAAVTTTGTEISKVVHLGRRPTALQRTALQYLTGGVCSVEGCGSSARLETDHVADWATTHRTELAQLAPLCGHHHDLKTHDGHRLGPLQPDGKRQLIPPDDRRHDRPPGRAAPPDLVLVEEPHRPPPASGSVTAGGPRSEELAPTPSSLERRARSIGRRNQRTLFDTG